MTKIASFDKPNSNNSTKGNFFNDFKLSNFPFGNNYNSIMTAQSFKLNQLEKCHDEII